VLIASFLCLSLAHSLSLSLSKASVRDIDQFLDRLNINKQDLVDEVSKHPKSMDTFFDVNVDMLMRLAVTLTLILTLILILIISPTLTLVPTLTPTLIVSLNLTDKAM
jgi:hypothetical protein